MVGLPGGTMLSNPFLTRRDRPFSTPQLKVGTREPAGHVEPDDVVIIPHQIKLAMLDYLQKGHGIGTETIYNDLHGFIRSRAIHREAFEHLNSAVVHSNRGDDTEVIRACTQALDLNPRMIRALQLRGNSYLNAGDHDHAIEDFTRVLNLNPNSVAALMNRGIARYYQGDLDMAITDFDAVAELRPGYAQAYNWRGQCYQDKGEPENALADFDKAIEIDPEFGSAYNNRGLIYHHAKDFEAAIENYEQMIAWAPKSPTGYCNLGEAWLHLGDWGKARANLMAAANMGGDIVASFKRDYASIEEFERLHDLVVPQDIAQMLMQ